MVVIGAGLGRRQVLVHLAVAAQVGHDAEVAATARNLTTEGCILLVGVIQHIEGVGGETHASHRCGCTCASGANSGA